MTRLPLRPLPHETWEDVARRIGREAGLERELMEEFARQRHKYPSAQVALARAIVAVGIGEVVTDG